MPRGEHRPSALLSKDENEQLFSLIGPKCQSLATAVVQLFSTEGPAHSEWKKRDTGVLCLIKDNAKRSYFFRIFCLYRKTLIWEHEVYTQIEYKSPRPFLHTFEAEEYMTAFNFANEDEARLLRTILIEKIELRKIKREEKRQRTLLAARSNPSVRQNGSMPPPVPTPMPEPEPTPAPVLPPKAVPLSANNSNYNTLSKSSNKKNSKLRKITKADIGMPQDFKHISHVGWDAQRGFDVDKLPDEDLRSFLSKAGVSETQLQDQDTREFIYGFIETHGGLDAVKEDLDQTVASKVAARPPPPPAAAPSPPAPAAPPAPPAPPVPERTPTAHPPAPPSRAPPPPPARAVPPPPAARHAPPPRPLQPPTTAPPSVPPPPPPGAAPPPPPPPPPPPLAPPPPPAPPTPSVVQDFVAAPPDPRAMLMESIRSGNKNLKRVEVSNDAPPVVEDSRSNLLSDIRKGISLKKTEVSRSGSSSGSSGRVGVGVGGGAAACGLAGALARALEERSRAIHSSDSDLSDNSDIDDDWD